MASSGPLTIVMGVDTFSPDVNGAARFAERLSAGLVERGHTVHVLAPAADHHRVGTFTEIIEGQPMTVWRARSWRWYPHDWLRFILPWRSKHYARWILNAVKPEIVHFQSHIVVGRGLSIEAEKRHIPMVATNHVMPENILDFTVLPRRIVSSIVAAQWRSAARAFARTRAVTTPTRKAAEFLEAHSGIDNVLAVSCGIRASNYTADLTPRAQHRILFVGRVTLEKHVDVLLDAITKLPEDVDVMVDIVGGGDKLQELRAQTVRLGLGERVTFHGRVDDDQLRRFYTEASIFAMPSIAELQSIATMEAMASGLVIVAADAMALPHLVHDGENGYLFPAGDSEALAERITRILTSGEEAILAMREASLDGVKMHDIERTLDIFEALYRGEPVPE